MAFHIFSEGRFDDLSRTLLARLEERVRNEVVDYILNVNEAEYVDHLVNEFELDNLEIQFDAMEVSHSERMVRAEHFPSHFHVLEGKSYPRPVITYHIPFTGDAGLLKQRPNPALMSSVEVEVRGNTICFEMVTFTDDPESIKRDADYNVSVIRQQSQHLVANVRAYNDGLRAQVLMLVQRRKGELQKRHGILAALGVPIKKAANVPQTFAVPVVRKKAVARPQPAKGAGTPEPALDAATYNDILRTIHETGKQFERLPSTYTSKGEEALRDHLILVLEPRYEGSTTGETFNKAGKTDILMRHEKKNVFVAECKFWGGQKLHHQTIDQILSYLTWRDSKAAIVYFVKGKAIAPVLRSVDEDTASHAHYVSAKGKQEESWSNHVFHLPGDPDRHVEVAILCFHLPE